MLGVSFAGGKNSIFDLRLVENCLCALRPRGYTALKAVLEDCDARPRQTALLRVGGIVDVQKVLVGFMLWCA